MTRTVFLVAIGASLLADPAAAQDTGQVGIAMGYPAAIGVLWHVSDRIGLRPELSLSRVTTENTFTIAVPLAGIVPTSDVSTSESWQVGTGVSALFYLVTGGALRTYVSPRFSYARSSSTSTTTLTSLSPPTPSTTVNSSYGIAGSVGAQYAIAKRFGVFGEVGVAYGRATVTPELSSSSFTRSDSKSTNVSLRSGAGVILYFGS